MGEATLRPLPGGAGGDPLEGFEVGYIDLDGVERRVRWADAWPVRFELCRPARRFPQYKGQKHHPGRWWTDWSGWLKSHAGKQIAAPKGYGKGTKFKAIEPAPGRYVKQKA